MMYLDLILNLALLIALSVISGFIDKRWPRSTLAGSLLQGFLFGSVAIVGMLRPLVLGPGLIFDGRTVMLSLCGLFFGPRACVLACAMAFATRTSLGGAGLIMGLTTILSSSAIGVAAFYMWKPVQRAPSLVRLYAMGLAVHAMMVALMFTLPDTLAWETFKRLALPVMLLYPLGTILAGKILADQLSNVQAMQALRESEERYRLLFDASLDAILLSAPDGRIFSANPAACALFGRTEEEITKIGRDGVVDPADPRLPAAIEERKRTGHFHGPLTLSRKDGSTFEGEVTSSTFINHQGEPRTGMIIRDMTARLQAEEPIRRLQNLLNETQRISKIGGWEFDVATRTVSWTDEVYAIHGLTQDYDPGNPKKDLSFYHPDDRPAVSEAFVRLVRKGEPYDLDVRLINTAGQTLWVRTMGRPVMENGRAVRMFGNIMDITERKQAEIDFHESEELFQGLFRDHAAVKLLIDPNTGQIIDANDAAAEFYGWTHAELIAMRIQDINTLSLEEVRQDRAIEKKRFRFEFRHRLANGSIRDVEVFSSRIELKKKTLLHSIISDITERKAAEAQIRALNEDLEQKVARRTQELSDSQLALLNIVDDLHETTESLSVANLSLEALNRELSAFSYSVSHDLRAPLRSIDGFGSALLEDYGDQLNDEGRNYLERIRRATQNMGRLIDDLLSLSRVTQSELVCEEVDLFALIREIEESRCQSDPRTRVTMTVEPHMRVMADEHLIGIALTNLLDNAWKFTAQCETPAIEFGSLHQNQETVYFVRDNGVGFDMKYAGKLFGTFQRLHRSDEFPGTGIGLATVQRIIHRHGGRIWAEAEVGKGATFYFTLPA